MISKADLDKIYLSVQVLRRSQRLDVCEFLEKAKASTVSTIADHIGHPSSYTSQILKDLRDIDIVTAYPVQRNIYYELNTTVYKIIINMIDLINPQDG